MNLNGVAEKKIERERERWRELNNRFQAHREFMRVFVNESKNVVTIAL